jgi:hypothetical protein
MLQEPVKDDLRPMELQVAGLNHAISHVPKYLPFVEFFQSCVRVALSMTKEDFESVDRRSVPQAACRPISVP